MSDKPEKEFPRGLLVKAPHERAPEYVKARLSIKREELIAWLQGKSGEWINLDVKVARSGKYYVEVDTWKPDGKKAERKPEPKQEPEQDEPFVDSDLPF